MADPLMAQPMPPEQGAPVPEQDAPTPDEQATFDDIVAGAFDHLHEPANRDAFVKSLRSAKNPAEVAGQTVLLLMQEAAQQAEATQREVDLGMLLDAATEVIDQMLEMAHAAKVKVADDEDFRAEALLSAVQAYVASKPPGSEEAEQAKAMLAEMQQGGMVQEGAAELQRLGQKKGVDPFAQAAPKEKPMAKGVRTGLMAG